MWTARSAIFPVFSDLEWIEGVRQYECESYAAAVACARDLWERGTLSGHSYLAVYVRDELGHELFRLDRAGEHEHTPPLWQPPLLRRPSVLAERCPG